MTDEPETDDEEVETYIPEAALIHEDSFLIFDQAEFAEHFNCWGAQLRDGSLFVLCRDTCRWRNVEDFGAPAPSTTKLKRVQ